MEQGLFRHIFTMLLCLPLYAVAQQRSALEAEDIAISYWKNRQVAFDKRLVRSMLLHESDNACFVTYRLSEGTENPTPGYIIIATDKKMPTILAYDDYSFFPTSVLPEHISTWFQGYEYMRQVYSNHPQDVHDWLQASRQGVSNVLPLLDNIEWGQDNPYNMYCPMVNNERCPSGCVATALAQIMRHHQWPQTGTGAINYQTATHKIGISYDFSSTTFEWDKLEDAYSPVVNLVGEGDCVVKDKKYFFKSLSVDKLKDGSACYVNVNSLRFMGASSFKGETLLLLTDSDDNFIERASSAFEVVSRYSGEVINNRSFQLYVPKSLPDGTYRIYSATRIDGVQEWSLANKQGGGDNFLLLRKKNEMFIVGEDMFLCSPSAEEIEPVATLLQAVGAAVEMDYAPEGSGSNDAKAQRGLISYLGYDPDMYFAYPENYTDEQWHQMLQHELTEGRPVYYTGQGNSVGHAFVIDGMQTDSKTGLVYYHVNWGWDGLCNGYYLLNMLRPSSTGTGGSSGSNYSNKPSMLIGLKPDDGISHMTMTCRSLDVRRNELFAGQFLPVCLRKLSLQTSSSDYIGDLRLELRMTNSEEDKVTVIYREPRRTITMERGLSNYYIPCQIPTDMESGNYQLVVACTSEIGEEIEINMVDWPHITIKDKKEWNGGLMTQPLQKLAIGKNCYLTGQDGVLTLNVDSLVNPMPNATSGQLAILICDSNGAMTTEPTEQQNVIVTGYGVRKKVEIKATIFKNFSDGDYNLKIGYLPVGESLWTLCDQMECQGSIWWADYNPLSIQLTIKEGHVSIPGVLEMEGADNPHVDSIVAPFAKISSTGKMYDLIGREKTPSQRGVYVQITNGKSIKKAK